ncbi:MAG: Wadjet anti-phage system protein JetD domain-containing protein, partial [Bacteroidales bacterium]
ENLTSFHTFNEPNMFTIYLGGYHNKIRREFIKKMYEKNPNISYLHFGDIDAGGFYILEHLRRETGVDFKPYKMDIETIKSYKGYTKKLTENDRIRLNRLLDSKYSNVIEFMLENNCKLEQESTNL